MCERKSCIKSNERVSVRKKEWLALKSFFYTSKMKTDTMKRKKYLKHFFESVGSLHTMIECSANKFRLRPTAAEKN